jgi:hypothetical protein
VSAFYLPWFASTHAPRPIWCWPTTHSRARAPPPSTAITELIDVDKCWFIGALIFLLFLFFAPRAKIEKQENKKYLAAVHPELDEGQAKRRLSGLQRKSNQQDAL